MILVDTSIWVDFFRNTNPALHDRLSELLENKIVVGLSSVFGELIQGARTEDEERTLLEFWSTIDKVDEEHLFIEAGIISNRYKLHSKGVSLIDCHILAAAKTFDLNLWTLDKRLHETYERIMK